MARILVQADDQRTVLLDERSIKPEHMSDEYSAEQLIQRLRWAITEESNQLTRRKRRIVPPAHESALTRTFD